MANRETESTFLGKLIKNKEITFFIPCYQRPYEWESKQVEALFSDLERLYRNIQREEDQNNITSQHFIGTMFWKSKKKSINSISEWWIIDGQQRLTTIFLILNALKQHLIENHENFLTEEAINDIKKYLYHENGISKLKPYSTDCDYYSIIQDSKWETESKDITYIKTYSKIKKATSELYKTIKNENNLDDKKATNLFLNLINLLNIVIIELTDNDDPEAIFESINSKGKSLKQFDLIRNFVLLQYDDKDEQLNAFNNKWKILENKINTIAIKKQDSDSIIRLFVASKTDKLCNKRDIYWEVQNILNDIKVKNPEMQKQELAAKLIDEMYEFVAMYTEIVKPLEENEINRILKKIERTEQMGTFMSLVIYIYKNYKRQEIALSDTNEIFKLIYSFIMRREICTLPIKNLSRLSPDLVSDFSQVINKSYESFRKILITRVEKTDSRAPYDEEVYWSLKNLDIYSKKKGRLAREILIEIENFLSGQKNSYSFEDNLSIEHIAPQSPSSEWLDHFDNDQAKYNMLNNTIGNLTLVSKSDNSSMGNKFIDIKNSILKQSKHIKLNEYFEDCDSWNAEKIQNRTEKLSRLICSIYKI